MGKKRFVLTLVFLSIVGYTLAAAEPASSQERKTDNKNGKNPLPNSARWNLRELQTSFTIISTQYNKETSEVIWTLEAKKGAKNPGYRALFLDSDFVEVANERVQLSPSQREYDKGARVQAFLKLPSCFKEANTVTVRASK